MHAPANVRQDNMSGAYACSCKAFEAEARAQQQHALAVNPVRLIHEQLGQTERWEGRLELLEARVVGDMLELPAGHTLLPMCPTSPRSSPKFTAEGICGCE
jgi:hypothetical protein